MEFAREFAMTVLMVATAFLSISMGVDVVLDIINKRRRR